MSTHQSLIMGTRGSALALAQSRMIAHALQEAHPDLRVEERIIRTTGDKQQGQPLPEIGGKGVFTLEIEQALLKGEIDFAVHSLKDLPPELPDGLRLAAIPQRESAADVCILKCQEACDLSAFSLHHSALIGTSSLRRRAQLLHLRPDLQVADIRGNIDTRLRKLREENWDAIVLAQAGLSRLGLEKDDSRSFIALNEREFVPAPGQGALAIEARSGDGRVLPLLRAIESEATRAEITAERAAMRHLNAGCSTPLGARAVAQGDTLHLWAVVLSPDGRQRVFAEARGELNEAETVGVRVAEELIKQGAGDLLSTL